MKKIIQEIENALTKRVRILEKAKEPIEILKEVRLLNELKVKISKFQLKAHHEK